MEELRPTHHQFLSLPDETEEMPTGVWLKTEIVFGVNSAKDKNWPRDAVRPSTNIWEVEERSNL